jgi:hypothetical protein
MIPPPLSPGPLDYGGEARRERGWIDKVEME